MGTAGGPAGDGASVPAAGAAPRILLIEGALRDNGGLRVSHDLARRWAAADVPVTLLVLERVAPVPPMFAPAPGVPWVYASGRVRRFRTALPWVLVGLLRHSLRADVLISGSEVGWGLLLGWGVARATRRPFFTMVHSPLQRAVDDWRPARLRPALRWVHRHVDRAFCVAPGLVGPMVSNGLPAERVEVTPVGIDVDDVIRRGRATSGDAADDAALDDAALDDAVASGPMLVGMGRLAPAKGFDLLVDASARVQRLGLRHRLVIVGEGPSRSALEGQIAATGFADRIRLVGHLDEPQPTLAGADLFVLSSRHEGNGSLVLLEALAHGRPVVAADCETGPREVLHDGALGELVAVEDVDALAAALAGFVRDPGPLRAKALSGPARARDFDQAAAAQFLLDRVREVVGG